MTGSSTEGSPAAGERPGAVAAGPEAAGAGPEAAGAEAAPGAAPVEPAVADPEPVEVGSEPSPAGPAANLVAAGIVVVLGGAGLAGALNLGLGSASKPGPGLWPAVVSAVLLVLGTVLAARARRTDDAERFSRAGLLVVAAVATMVVFVAVISVIGFEIPTAALAFVWLRFLGHESWRTSILLSAALTAAFYALFVGALDVTIPHLL